MAATETRITRADALRALSSLSPLAADVAGQLAIPESLFETGPASFSTDPALPASVISGCFKARLPVPERLPEYAIDVSQYGSSLFCTLVDRSRRILIGVRVGSAGAKDIDWDAVSLAIREAQRLSGRLRASKRRFSYVMAGDDGAEAV